MLIGHILPKLPAGSSRPFFFPFVFVWPNVLPINRSTRYSSRPPMDREFFVMLGSLFFPWRKMLYLLVRAFGWCLVNNETLTWILYVTRGLFCNLAIERNELKRGTLCSIIPFKSVSLLLLYSSCTRSKRVLKREFCKSLKLFASLTD